MRFSATVCEKQTDRAPILFPGGILRGIRAAARIGYRAVELHMKDPAVVDPGKVKDALREEGVTLTSIGTGMAYGDDGLSFSSTDEKVRARAVERIQSFVDAYADLKPLIIVGLIRGRVGEPPARDAAVARIEEALAACCRYAAARGMALTVEAINRYEQDWLNRVEEVAALIGRVGAANLTAHVDTYHMNIEEEGMEAALFAHRERLGHVHFADNNRRYPGAGRLDFKPVLRCLRDVGYQGVVALECLPWPDPETAARRGLAYLQGLGE